MLKRDISDAERLRAKIAQHRVVKYKLAALADIHPCRLSRLLNEKELLTTEAAEHIERVLDDLISAGKLNG